MWRDQLLKMWWPLAQQDRSMIQSTFWTFWRSHQRRGRWLLWKHCGPSGSAGGKNRLNILMVINKVVKRGHDRAFHHHSETLSSQSWKYWHKILNNLTQKGTLKLGWCLKDPQLLLDFPLELRFSVSAERSKGSSDTSRSFLVGTRGGALGVSCGLVPCSWTCWRVHDS